MLSDDIKIFFRIASLIKQIKIQTRKLALALKVKGFLNIQYAIKNDEIYVIEVNPRASRTVPFVAKATNTPIAKIASRIMAGQSLASFGLEEKKLSHVCVKEAVFPFARFPGVDIILGPEMKSTGEAIRFIDNLEDPYFRKIEKERYMYLTR